MGSVRILVDSYGPGTGGWLALPSGALHTNVNDSSDTTFDQAPAAQNGFNVGFANAVIPPYAQIRSVQPTIRLSGGSNALFAARLGVGASWRYFTAFQNPAVAITSVVYPPQATAPDGGQWDQTKVNSVQMSLAGWNPVKVYQVHLDVVYDEAPVVTLDGPIGTVTDGNTPTITWQYADPENAPQEQFIAKLFTDAQKNQASFNPDKTAPFWNATVKSSSQQVAVTAKIPAGVWWAYVKASDQGSKGRFGAWSRLSFGVAGSPPAIPTATVTNDDVNRRNVITVQGQDNLLSYNEAGAEATGGIGWYPDTASGVSTGTTTSVDGEGTKLLKQTSTGATLGKIRSGGAWGTLIGSLGQITIDDSSPGWAWSKTGDVTSLTFTPPSGALLLAMVGAQYWGGPNDVGTKVFDSQGGGWTKVDRVSNPAAATTSANLYSGNQGTFETLSAGVAGWAAATASHHTLVRDTVQHHTGVASLKVTPTGLATLNDRVMGPITSPNGLISAGDTPTVSAWVRSATSRSYSMSVDTYDKDGGFLATVLAGSPTALVANTWTQLTFTTSALIGAVAQIRPGVAWTSTNPSTSDIINIDDVTITLTTASGSASSYGDEAAIFRRYADGNPLTVSLRGLKDNTKEKFLRVLALTGAHGTVPVGAHGTGFSLTGMGSTGTVSYTTTATNSRGFAMWTNDLRLQSPAPARDNQIDTQQIVQRNQFATIKRFAPVPVIGTTIPIGLSSPLANTHATYCYVEILPNSTPPHGTPLAVVAGIPVTPAGVYEVVASAWLQTNAARNARVDVEWYDDTGTLLSTTTGTSFPTRTDSLFAPYIGEVTAPAGATAAVMVLVFVNPSGAGEIMQWDRLGFMPAGNDHWSRGGLTVVNMLTPDAGSQETALGGWTLTTTEAGTSVARTADATTLSGQVAKVTFAASSVGNSISVPPIVIDPGLDYVLSAYVKKSSAATYQHTVRLEFLDGNGAVLSVAEGDPVDGSTTSWAGPVWAHGVAPEDATSVQPRLITSMTAAASQFSSWTRIQLAPGVTTPPTMWQPGPYALAYPLVEFSDDGGLSWDTVRYTESTLYDPTTQLAVVYDYEAPPGATRLYRVSTAAIDYIIDPTGATVIVSDPTEQIPCLLTPSEWWLKDPQLPGSLLMVDIQGDLVWSRKRRQGKFSPLNRNRPIITFDVMEGRETDVELFIVGEPDKNTYEDMLESGRTLLLQSDMGQQWYVQPDEGAGFTLVNAPGRLLGTPIYQTKVKLIETDRP